MVSGEFFSAHFPLGYFVEKLFGGELFSAFIEDDSDSVWAS